MSLLDSTMKILIILVLMSATSLFISAGARQLNGAGCVTSDGSRGRCVSITACPVLYNLLQDIRNNRAPPGTTDFLRSNICQKTPELLVCCKVEPTISATVRPKVPDASECGKSALTHRVVGGINAPLFAWPWMALIQARANQWSSVSFTCGAVLISNRHILTAAHCTNKNPSLPNLDIFFIRLGEYDLAQDPDCKNNHCAKNHLDALVDRVIVHPGYEKVQGCHGCNDIALIKLLDPIDPNPLGIFPICLPTHFEHQLNVDPTTLQNSNKLAYIAGWGSINKNPYIFERPNILQEAEIPFGKTEYCTDKLKSYQDPNSVFCAGDIHHFSADTCRGDSGGPIMMSGKNSKNEKTWYLLGITSRGPTVCGLQGSQGIYTNVTYYLPWISENMKI
ncbi:unnamed protein product, partial [Meganyctiphanes norvegica]